MERLVLIGFMGSGKTTLGRRLAARLGWEFVDLDSRIEAAAGRSIATQFAEDGETAFRAREIAALRALASAPPARAVVATGGGIVDHPDAAALLRSLGCIVWLRADPEIAIARIAAQAAVRPLAAGDGWRRLGREREPRYAALAEHVVATDHASEAESLAAIAAWVGRRTE